ncbi:PEP-CTERM sorting domain-containing protein [Pirellulales bacterium]|nr:PEP-CTERM sorting domain-containing protein [Pirellulales bacterium]
MRLFNSSIVRAGIAGLAAIVAAEASGQTLDAVIVQDQPVPAIYTIDLAGPPGGQFSLSAIAFPSGSLLPPHLINSIQWTDPEVPPPNVDPQIFFYQFNDPSGLLPFPQLQIGNLFGAMGFIDGVIDLNQPPGQATFNVPPLVPPGNFPNDPIQRAGQLGGPQPFQNTIIYHDPQPEPDGLQNTIIVGLALPGLDVTHRGMVVYGQADPLFEPGNPHDPGGNGEFFWAPAPVVPDPCIDDSLLTQEMFDYLNAQETANGINIMSETEVVNFQTVRDRIVSSTDADDGFTYVTVVEDFVTTAFYRFPTGTADPKGIITTPGDYDLDGDVDGDDLLVWADGGSPNPGSSADLDAWQKNYGHMPAPPAAATVPEPTTATMLLLGSSMLLRRRQRRT